MLTLLIITRSVIILFVEYVNLLNAKFLLFISRAPRFLFIYVYRNAENLLSRQLFTHLFHYEFYSYIVDDHRHYGECFFYLECSLCLI